MEKHTKILIAALLIMIAIIISSTASFATTMWVEGGTTGFSAGTVSQSKMAVGGNRVPYVAYKDISNGGKIKVMKYDGANWVSINQTWLFPAPDYMRYAIAADETGPYVACPSGGALEIAKYDGTTWTAIPTGVTGMLYGIDITIDSNGTPYVVTIPDGTVYKYNGTNWESIGDSVVVGSPQYVEIETDGNGFLYVLYTQITGEVDVVKYDGVSWAPVGEPTCSAIEYYQVNMAISENGTPYIAYRDASKTTVIKYDGTAWAPVGIPRFSTGVLTTFSAFAVVADDNGPYIAYSPSGGSLEVLKYVEPSWVAAGLVPISSPSAGSITMEINNGDLYTSFVNSKTAIVKRTISDHTVSYNGNGATSGSAPPSVNIFEGQSTGVEANSLIFPGHSFTRWDTQSDGNGTACVVGDNLTMGTSDIELYAQWDTNIYTVSYDANGAVGITPSTVWLEYNSSTVAAINTYMKQGYIFNGWNTTPDGSGSLYASGDAVTVTSQNITLYAQWQTASNTYIVTFNSNSQYSVPSQTVEEGWIATEPTVPESVTRVLLGWYKEPTYATPWRFSEDLVFSNTPLYARWGARGDIDCDGNLDSLDESLCNQIIAGSITYSAIQLEIADINNDGVLNSLDVQQIASIINGTLICGIVLQVEGVTISSINGVYGATSTPTAANPAGSTIIGWYTDSGLTNLWSNQYDVLVGRPTLYAKTTVAATTTSTVTASTQTSRKTKAKPKMIGYIEGYPDGTFKQGYNVTREEVAKMLILAKDIPVNESRGSIYIDIETGRWSNPYIAKATELNIFLVPDNKQFVPAASVTRAELITYILRMLKQTATSNDNPKNRFSDLTNQAYTNNINKAAELGLVKGYEDGTFRPEALVRRNEAVAMINRALFANILIEEIKVQVQFSDVRKSDWAYDEIYKACNI